jgi:hypothetical protein
MNLDDFEKKLGRQPMRDIPGHWRDEILRAAAAREERWWEAWLWPSPRAWAGLAAAWVVILGINLATTRNAPRQVAFSRQELRELQQQQQMLANLIAPTPNGELPRPKTTLSPRSDRQRRQIGV